METWQKIIFWIATTTIIIDNIYWQWWIKLIIPPASEPPGGILGSMIADAVTLILWLWLLIKIYKLANRKD